MKIIINTLIIFIFLGCFGEEKKVVTKKVKKEPVKYMVEKVKKIVDKNTSLSQIVQEDGIVVDGSRDEDLLDAFGLAVSKIMEEEGISVPDCTALSETQFITKEECDEISDKYFGFYDIYTEDGIAKKVDDVFENGVVGKDVEIREGSIDFFDSSGNPLLNNQVEFEELVDETNDIDILNKLKQSIPKEKIEMLKKVKQKLAFLDDVRNEEKRVVETRKKIQTQKKVEKSRVNNASIYSNEQVNTSDQDKSRRMYNQKSSALSALIAQHKRTNSALMRDSSNQKLIDKYNQEEIDIAILEQEVEMYKSEI